MVDAHGQPVNGDSFLVVVNVSPEDVTFQLPAARLGTRWTVELTSADPGLPGGDPRAARARGAVHVVAVPDGPPARVTPVLPRDLPPPARHRPRPARRARAAALPRRPRDLARLPVAGLAGARRLDARLRRDRPRRDLARARRRGGAARAERRGARARHGADPRRRAEPHGGRRRQRVLGRPASCARSSSTSTRRPAAGGGSSTSTSWPACARRTRRSSRRRTGSCSRSRARASSTACASTTRTASRIRRATCERLAAGGAEHVWVEKILDPDEHLRDWPVEGTVGYEFANDVTALFCDPAAEAVFEELWDGRRVRRRRAGGQARAGARRRSRPRWTGCGGSRTSRTWPSRWRRCRSTAPTCATGQVSDEDRAALAGCDPAVREAVLAGGPFATRFQQTTPPVMAKGVEDTAFYRHVRFLALNEVGGDPSRWSIGGRRASTPATLERAARFPRASARLHDARHQALRRRARAAARPDRDGGRLGRRGAVVARGQRGARLDPVGRGAARLPDAARRLADHRRPPRALPREGAARGEGHVELDRAGPRARGAREALRGRAARPRPVPVRLRRRRRARGGARRADRAGPDAAEADLPRRSRHLPGRRAVGALARRPRQPAARRLGRATRRAGRAARR